MPIVSKKSLEFIAYLGELGCSGRMVFFVALWIFHTQYWMWRDVVGEHFPEEKEYIASLKGPVSHFRRVALNLFPNILTFLPISLFICCSPEYFFHPTRRFLSPFIEEHRPFLESYVIPIAEAVILSSLLCFISLVLCLVSIYLCNSLSGYNILGLLINRSIRLFRECYETFNFYFPNFWELLAETIRNFLNFLEECISHLERQARNIFISVVGLIKALLFFIFRGPRGKRVIIFLPSGQEAGPAQNPAPDCIFCKLFLDFYNELNVFVFQSLHVLYMLKDYLIEQFYSTIYPILESIYYSFIFYHEYLINHVIFLFIFSFLYLYNQNLNYLKTLFYIETLYSFCILFSFRTKVYNYDFRQNYKDELDNFFYILPEKLDGVSLNLIMLTFYIFFLCFILLGESMEHRDNLQQFYFLLTCLKSVLVMAFIATSFLIFYISFEAVLIFMFIIIGVWGSRSRKVKANYLFFFYTFISSFFFLIGLFIQVNTISSYSFWSLTNNLFLSDLASVNVSIFDGLLYHDTYYLSYSSFCYQDVFYQKILFPFFFIALAVKVPMVPFHLWLPEAHVEAPTVGSVILAGILLKLGGYGILRFILPVFPDAVIIYQPYILIFGMVGVIYASLSIFFQVDMKRIVAYSSIAHMNFSIVGLFSLTGHGLVGSYYLMISHGLVSSGLFFIIGCLYDRYKSRIVGYYSGLSQTMPLFTFFFVILTLSNLALPGTSSFIGEALVLFGLIKKGLLLALFCGTSVVLGGAYSLYLLNRICYLHPKTNIELFYDLTKIEFFILFSLSFINIYLGLNSVGFISSYFLDLLGVSFHFKLK